MARKDLSCQTARVKHPLTGCKANQMDQEAQRPERPQVSPSALRRHLGPLGNLLGLTRGERRLTGTWPRATFANNQLQSPMEVAVAALENTLVSAHNRATQNSDDAAHIATARTTEIQAVQATEVNIHRGTEAVQIRRLTREKRSLKAQLATQVSQNEDLETHIKSLEQQLKAAEQLEKELKAAQDKSESHRHNLEIRFLTKVSEMKLEAQTAEGKYKAVQEKLKDVGKKLEAAAEKLKTAEEDVNEMEHQVKWMKTELENRGYKVTFFNDRSKATRPQSEPQP